MARRDSPLDDEKRSYGAVWLLLSLLLLVCALWAVLDDNVFRRPWKKYQAGFERIEISTIEGQIAAEQAKLDADPAYRDAMAKVAEAQQKVDSGETAAEIKKLQQERETARLADMGKDLNLRFI